LVQGIIFARIENDQIAENWTLIDQIGMLQQLGIVPPPKVGDPRIEAEFVMTFKGQLSVKKVE